ncbi:ParB/Srx family N-terminal domain-containing protein, partial [Blastococcus sp. CT_GayMR20]|uniref:ParB/RepB/Spo0J family partition protein n=1 Tax=Blastococcus sp. CT_GayMR20 TaxID=2559609 RepID=UPI001430C028
MTTDNTSTSTDSATTPDTAAELRVQQLDPHSLLVDANVRHDTRADADLVASVRDLGVLVPIVAVRTADGRLRVRLGHRRTLAAIEAGRPTVPVVVAADETV